MLMKRCANFCIWLTAVLHRVEPYGPELKHERTLRHGPNARPETKAGEAEA